MGRIDAADYRRKADTAAEWCRTCHEETCVALEIVAGEYVVFPTFARRANNLIDAGRPVCKLVTYLPAKQGQ